MVGSLFFSLAIKTCKILYLDLTIKVVVVVLISTRRRRRSVEEFRNTLVIVLIEGFK